MNVTILTPNQEEKLIDWSNSSDRKWLMNHLHWAMNNRKGVMLVPTESVSYGDGLKVISAAMSALNN
jgi:hypothetical protein